MATFLVLQQELADRLANYDQTVSADATKLKRWLNLAQQYISGKHLWPFMLASEIVQTVPDYTTGTVATTADSTSITFSGTIAVSRANSYVQFEDSNDWYKITAHTAGTATATISPAAINTNTAATYKIRKLHYTTSTPMIQIMDIKQLISPANMQSLSPLAADFYVPLYYGSGTITHFIISVPDSTGKQQFSLFLTPSEEINLMVRGYKALTDLSADADVSVIPSPWHDALVNIAAYYGFQGLDDTRAREELAIGEARISDMKANYRNDPARHRVMSAVNSELSELGWNLPPYDNY